MITYKNGNLLESNCDIICHQVNCQKVMGSGIAKQIREKWPVVYYTYCDLIEYYRDLGLVDDSSDLLGQMQLIKTEDKYVANFFSQDKYLPRSICHTDYKAFRMCCVKLKDQVIGLNKNLTIGFPYKIGCGLAGGDWSIVEKIIEEEFEHFNVEIWKYD